MFPHFVSSSLKYATRTKLQSPVFNNVLVYQTFSTALKPPIQQTKRSNIRRYVKYLACILGGGMTVSFVYTAYQWILRVPICPNFNPEQNININHILACTSLVPYTNKQCSGQYPMKKVGAATGVSYKLVKVRPDNANISSHIILNDKTIAERNLFDVNYMSDYVLTLADLLMKLDENRRVRLLSNMIGYYIFVCLECHSSITRQMISCTAYLSAAGLRNNAADISEVETAENQT